MYVSDTLVRTGKRSTFGKRGVLTAKTKLRDRYFNVVFRKLCFIRLLDFTSVNHFSISPLVYYEIFYINNIAINDYIELMLAHFNFRELFYKLRFFKAPDSSAW